MQVIYFIAIQIYLIHFVLSYLFETLGESQKRLQKFLFIENLELASNLCFHLAFPFQNEVFKSFLDIHKRTNFLFILAELKKELVSNLCFVLERSDHDLVWARTYRIILQTLKFFQNLMEESNIEIKKIFGQFSFKIEDAEVC